MYKQIVVGTDGSGSARVAVDAAIELAALTGARLHVVHAHNVTKAAGLATSDIVLMQGAIAESNDAVRGEGERICAQAVETARSAGVEAEGHCVGGGAADALVRVAGDTNADLIVVGNRGMTGARRMLGSVPNKVAHHCPTSILIVDTRD